MSKSTNIPVIVIATMIVSILGLAAPAGAAETVHTCFGEEATIVGTEGRDYIRGTKGRDVIVGLGGNDIIRGLAGDDLICGNEGHDRVWGQAGNDQINGGYGRDRIQAGAGNDVIKGMQGIDRIWGGLGNDTIKGNGGNDIIIVGHRTADTILGGNGWDTVRMLAEGGANGGRWVVENVTNPNFTPPAEQAAVPTPVTNPTPTPAPAPTPTPEPTPEPTPVPVGPDYEITGFDCSTEGCVLTVVNNTDEHRSGTLHGSYDVRIVGDDSGRYFEHVANWSGAACVDAGSTAQIHIDLADNANYEVHDIHFGHWAWDDVTC